jgi:hypothetical protein
MTFPPRVAGGSARVNSQRLPGKSPYFRADVGWFMDQLGDVQVVYMDGRVTDASFEHYLEAVAADIDARTEDRKIGVVYHVPQPSAMSAARRRKLAAVLKQREAKLARNTAAYAMATPSALVRGGLRMLFWLAPPPYPNAVVPTPVAAFEFVAKHMPGLVATELAAELERTTTQAAPEMQPR